MWILILVINMHGIVINEYGGKYASQRYCMEQGYDEMNSLYQNPVIGFKCYPPEEQK